MPNTIAVSVTFTLNSTYPNTPPYNITGINGIVGYDSGPNSTFNTWSPESVGTPQPQGATFALAVTDAGYVTNNPTSIGNWALTFIPRGSTTQQSPFKNNQNTITGTGGTNNGSGTFTLTFNNPVPKIQTSGSWDWSLMVQINIPGGTVHCFGSDPEMDVT